MYSDSTRKLREEIQGIEEDDVEIVEVSSGYASSSSNPNLGSNQNKSTTSSSSNMTKPNLESKSGFSNQPSSSSASSNLVKSSSNNLQPPKDGNSKDRILDERTLFAEKQRQFYQSREREVDSGRVRTFMDNCLEAEKVTDVVFGVNNVCDS